MSLLPGATKEDAPARAVFNFNPGWRLFVGDPPGASDPGFDDSAWPPVTLPHAWNEDAAFREPIDRHPTGVAWYRKTFRLPKEAEGRKVFLEFEGVRQAAEVYLNGRLLGRHENGVMAFGLDVTEASKPSPATNTIAVRTDNDWSYAERSSGQRFQWADRNFNANYGGIPKNVRLHVTDRVYQTLPLYSHLGTTGVYVYVTDIDVPGRRATVHAESEVRNEAKEPRTFTYRVTINDPDGRTVAAFDGGRYTVKPGETLTARAKAPVTGLSFWSWGYGYLYTVTTSLEADGTAFDTVATKTGFRKTEFARGMFTLNDRVLQLKGYAQRTSNEWPAVGMSVPPWLSDLSNHLMVESSANLVRWMHVTPWKQDVESCDRVGLMQMMPAGDSERDAQGRAWAQRLELMRDAIVYNRNHPSIVVYEAGNKGISEEHMAEMKALRDRFDPFGGRATGSREMLDSAVAEYGGEMLYVNKSAGRPLWAMEYSRDEGLRKYWDDFSPPFHKDGDGPPHRNAPAPEYNRNQDSHAIEDVRRWYDYWRERPGTGRRVSAGGLNIVFSDTNTHYRGAENYRRSGEVDPLRLPKDGFFAHQVMWDGWVDVERPRAHILGHWNYAPGVKKDVYVVSSADSVELTLNGRSLGRGEQSSRFLFTFHDVAWEPGTLRAVGFDAAGKPVCEASHQTAGPPAALKLTAHTAPSGWRADGADLALVDVEVVDAQGRRHPTALNLVSFDLVGPADWRGGLAQGPNNYILSRSLPVEAGVNRILLRSRPDPGHVILTARADGLPPARLDLDTLPVETTDGWSPTLPDHDLPARLDRGPTPAGRSFAVQRVPIPIASATAGSNTATVGASFDDNEVTAWTSDDDLTNAWIEYRLARSASLSEAVFKMSGWRERSYQLRILVDGREAYHGPTGRSLGYVSLPLQGARGQTVRIELVEPVVMDETSVTAPAEAVNARAQGADRRSRSLGIAEAEYYEPERVPYVWARQRGNQP